MVERLPVRHRPRQKVRDEGDVHDQGFAGLGERRAVARMGPATARLRCLCAGSRPQVPRRSSLGDLGRDQPGLRFPTRGEEGREAIRPHPGRRLRRLEKGPPPQHRDRRHDPLGRASRRGDASSALAAKHEGHGRQAAEDGLVRAQPVRLPSPQHPAEPDQRLPRPQRHRHPVERGEGALSQEGAPQGPAKEAVAERMVDPVGPWLVRLRLLRLPPKAGQAPASGIQARPQASLRQGPGLVPDQRLSRRAEQPDLGVDDVRRRAETLLPGLPAPPVIVSAADTHAIVPALVKRLALLLCPLLVLIAASAPSPPASASFRNAIWGPIKLAPGQAGCQGPLRCPSVPIYDELGVDVFQYQMQWDRIAPTRPADPRDPNDPAYKWSNEYQQLVNQAQAAGIQIMFMIKGAPPWANGGRIPRWAPTNPADYADFAVAVARKFPSVHLWEIWGESNRAYGFLPQGDEGPHLYARLLDAAYGALKGANPANTVVGGMTLGGGPDVTWVPQWLKKLKLPNGKPPRMDWFGHNGFQHGYPKLRTKPYGLFRGLNDVSVLWKEINRI